MDEVAIAFAGTMSRIIDELSRGRPYDPVSTERAEPGRYAREYFREINQAIQAARLLKALPAEVACFSVQEIGTIGVQARAYGTLRMCAKIQELILEALKCRRIPPEIIDEIEKQTPHRTEAPKVKPVIR
jgi:hypothetical protein